MPCHTSSGLYISCLMFTVSVECVMFLCLIEPHVVLVIMSVGAMPKPGLSRKPHHPLLWNYVNYLSDD